MASGGKSAGFSLGELCAFVAFFCALVIIALFSYPIFARKTTKNPNGICLSNEKQMGLAFLAYALDNDEYLPPAAQPLPGTNGILPGWAVTHNAQGGAVVAKNAQGKTDVEKAFASSPLIAYTKNGEIFHCPAAPKNSGLLSYMMNDLASGADTTKIPAPNRTILLCDGENFAGNVGHAYDASLAPAPAVYTQTGRVILGATLQKAPTRHNGGANYLLADGHAKWYKPTQVFFPPRFSDSVSHKDVKTGRIFGPAPAGDGRFAGKLYQARFHLR